MKRFTYILLFAVIFASCESDLVLNHKVQNKLVIYSLLSYDQVFEVKVSKTKSIFDPQDKITVVDNATVSIYNAEGEKEDELIYYEDSETYKSFKYPRSGQEYFLKVAHPDYETVSAYTQMPELDSVNVVTKVISHDSKTQTIIDVAIKDGNTRDFYIWETNVYDPLLKTNRRSNVSSLDERVDNILPFNDIQQQKIFLSGNGNNELIKSSFIAYDINTENCEQASVSLMVVSSEAYDYYKSIEIYNKTQTNYSDPIKIHSNIINGLGIFGARNLYVLKIVK